MARNQELNMEWQSFVVKPFDRSNFPSLFRVADDASTSAQKCYLLWVGANLSLLASGALASSVAWSDPTYKQYGQLIAALCFFVALFMSLLLAYKKWEKTWYGGRAIAESVKSLAWKYVTGADPFVMSLAEPDAVALFVQSLRDLMRERLFLTSSFAGGDLDGEQITEWMVSVRKSAVGVKRDVYWAQRVRDQQGWYARKSQENKKYRNIWFGTLVLLQASAGIAAILLAIYPLCPWRAPAVFSALASATVAWGQIKRFQELSQSYAYAALELSHISALAPHVGTREELSRFVNDAETAISREHASWVARREVA